MVPAGAAAAGAVTTGAGVAAVTAGWGCGGAIVGVGAGGAYGAGAAAGASSLAQALTIETTPARAMSDLRSNIEFSLSAPQRALVQ